MAAWVCYTLLGILLSYIAACNRDGKIRNREWRENSNSHFGILLLVGRVAPSRARLGFLAAELGAAESTIKVHLVSIMEKLAVRSPAELGRITQELGSLHRSA